MKNILVPTDFSACAGYAIDLGFAFAEFFDATLYLFACIDLPDDWDELSATEKDKLPEKKQLLENVNVFSTCPTMILTQNTVHGCLWDLRHRTPS